MCWFVIVVVLCSSDVVVCGLLFVVHRAYCCDMCCVLCVVGCLMCVSWRLSFDA